MYVMLVYAVALPRQSCLPRGGVLGMFYLPDHETPGAALRHLAAPGYDRSAEPEAQGTPRGRPEAPGSEMEVRLRCAHARATDHCPDPLADPMRTWSDHGQNYRV